MPSNLIEAVAQDQDERRRGWMATLPQTVKALGQRWALELGEPFQPGGQTAWVAPAHTQDHGDLVLKVAWRHTEAAHEADGLRVWDGHGAVRLHAAVGAGVGLV